MNKNLFEIVMQNAKNLPACDFPRDEVLKEVCHEMTKEQRTEFTAICLKKGVMEYSYGCIVTRYKRLVVVVG